MFILYNIYVGCMSMSMRVKIEGDPVDTDA